jgi:hypothetical protein
MGGTPIAKFGTISDFFFQEKPETAYEFGFGVLPHGFAKDQTISVFFS